MLLSRKRVISWPKVAKSERRQSISIKPISPGSFSVSFASKCSIRQFLFLQGIEQRRRKRRAVLDHLFEVGDHLPECIRVKVNDGCDQDGATEIGWCSARAFTSTGSGTITAATKPSSV
ncbi:hypothetical protein PHYPSEUDO_008245 [Phytophthora pseudosyringae]|uniref:Uncharacterized protein n=1 Tax=Phytophthora pseudosyringae TaxID=221518 RepID=A0A8T1VFJ3_9STRA|nr:hypothetical protein PHYPSEUDO_008245 [Phytophthora pseudosyringae]